jgi:hypothetical protein
MSKNKNKKQSVKSLKSQAASKKSAKPTKVLPRKAVKEKTIARSAKSGPKVDKKDLKKKSRVSAKPVPVVVPVKKPAVPVKPAGVSAAESAKAKKAKKVKKTQETEEIQDDFIETDGTSDEIGEYEEELKAVEEIDNEVDDEELWSLESKDKSSDEEIVLTDAEGNRYCRARDCDQIGTVDGYCRYHYLLFWKKIQVRKKILTDGKLERYIEELTGRYPDKFLEMIRRDLRTQKDFLGAIQELEIDEAGSESEFEEDAQSFIDEVRGMNETASVDDEEF